MPPELRNYVAQHPANSWDQFKAVRRRRSSVQQQLLSDQGGLCAYCEIDLKAAAGIAQADLRVEHFHPKSDLGGGHNWHLDWTNLLAVCHGGSRGDIVDAAERHTSPDHSCDIPKGGEDWDAVILTPLELPSYPCLFRFDRSSGGMRVDQENCRAVAIDADKAQATVDNLRLDSTRLRDLRKPVLDKLNQQLQLLLRSGIPIDEARTRLARVMLSKNANHHWPAFFSAIRHYLGDAAERQLRADGYLG